MSDECEWARERAREPQRDEDEVVCVRAPADELRPEANDVDGVDGDVDGDADIDVDADEESIGG